MKTKPIIFAVLTTAFVVFLAGCGTTAVSPQDSPKYSIENTEKFTHLDKTVQAAVSCTNLQERRLPDGRLEVVASLRNREDRALKVQINCVFKDEQGFSIGDETPFRTVAMAEDATEAVRFTSANPSARKYTLRVRLAR
jgi:uncharacterized protein YcfL